MHGQVLGQRRRRRIVEDAVVGSFRSGRRFEPIPEFHRTERIEAQFPELPVGAHRVGGIVPEHRGRVRPHERAVRVPLRACSSRQAAARDRQRTRPGAGLGGAPGRTDQSAEQRWHPPIAERAGWRRGRTGPGRRTGAPAGAPRRTAPARPPTTSAPSRTTHPCTVPLAEMPVIPVAFSHHPHARETAAVLLPAMMCERVEEALAGGVVGLAR